MGPRVLARSIDCRRGARSSDGLALLKFFGLTFALSWALWSLAGLVPVGTPLRTVLFLPGTFAPAIVALWLGGRSLLDRILIWPRQARWYVFAIFYMAAVKLVATGTWPAIEPGQWFVFVAAILVSAPFQAGEEIGWRRFALPRLTQRVGLGPAALLLGVIWAVWHLPLFLIAGTDTTGQSLPFFVISVTAISVALAWLYARTGGSLLLVMLMHSAVNNTPHFVPPVATGKVWALEASPVQWLTALSLWIGAGYLLLRMRRVQEIGHEVVPVP